MKPKTASLAAHLELRRQVATARHDAHARANTANVMLGLERELAALDARILDLEDTIARISDEQKPQRARFGFLWLRFEIVISDKKQLRELVAVLRTWRAQLADGEADRALAAAERLAAHLAKETTEPKGSAAETEAAEEPTQPFIKNGHSLSNGRWG